MFYLVYILVLRENGSSQGIALNFYLKKQFMSKNEFLSFVSNKNHELKHPSLWITTLQGKTHNYCINYEVKTLIDKLIMTHVQHLEWLNLLCQRGDPKITYIY